MAIISTLLVGFIEVQAIGDSSAKPRHRNLLALFMSNPADSGTTQEIYESGNEGGKKSPAHKAAVVEHRGRPVQDTTGPSINTRIRSVSL